ncbi:bifunctional diguanylate cyclase/phosphodiesterase [Aquipuribacter nitratireducens]|uniref:EAL domain-containing protein n=1 Tax=Aquipuribacter nitratireducens TaxID=650104 RepID=A0ABW0GMK0_9MICO
MTRSTPRRHPTGLLADALTVVGLGVVVLALSQWAVVLAPAGSSVAAWWPAVGAGVAAAVLLPRRLPAVLLAVGLGILAGNWTGGRPVDLSAGYAVANTAEVAVTAALLRFRGRTVGLSRLADLPRLAAAVAAGAVVGGVLAGAAVAVLDGGDLLRTALVVVPSHAAAQTLALPIALAAREPRSPRRPLERALQVTVLALTVLVVFVVGIGPLPFLPLVAMVWAAVRLGVRTVALELLVAAVAASLLTAAGMGAFARAGAEVWPASQAQLLQVYVIAAAMTVLPVAVSVRQRDRVLATVRRSEQLFRGGFTDALLGMLLLRPELGADGSRLVVLEANREAEAMLAAGAGSLRGSQWCARFTPPDRDLLLAAVDDLLAGRAEGWRHEVSTGGGSPRWFEVALAVVRLGHDEPVVAVQMLDVSARREAEMQLAHMALFDELTGLPNRVLLRDRLEQSLVRGRRSGQHPALLFCDLDDFKQINDTDGHAAGDAVLAAVADRLRACVRAEDTVARLGGDEFVVLCPDTDEAGVRRVAERIVSAVTEPLDVTGRPARVRVSVGIVLAGADSTADTMMRDADTAMYAAKSAGKGRFVVFDDEHRTRAVRLVRVADDLRRALRAGELTLHVQPVVDIADGRVVAGETLLRWHHPDDGLRLPGDWLDVAEGAGLMPELGRWVLERSCRTARSWLDALGPDAPKVHVNVSARQLDRDEDLADTVLGVLARTGLPGDRLVLELTETGFEAGRGRLAAQLDRLRVAGVAVAVDDLGTGYSSLARLVDLPVDMVKIDRAFVDAMTRDPRSLAVVRSVVALGSAIGTEVVAEGVETAEQADLLRRLGCPTGQGWLWSPAQEADAFLDGLRQRAGLATSSG